MTINVQLTGPQFDYVKRAVENDLEDIGELLSLGVADGFETEFAMARAVLVKMREIEQTEAVPF